MKQRNKKTLAILVVLLCSIFIFAQCRTSSISNQADESGTKGQSAPRISKCAKTVPQVTTNRDVTWMYHWTDSPIALSNPLEHVRKSVAAGAEAIQGGGAAGPGLYLASDPFSSVNYGKILVRVPIKANVRVANWEDVANQPDLEIYLKSGCSAILYSFNTLYDSFRFGKDRALVVSSMDAIETELEKITSFTRGEEESKPDPEQSKTKITDLPSLFRIHRLEDISGAASVASIILQSASKEQAEARRLYNGFKGICSYQRKTPDAGLLNSSFQAFNRDPEFAQYIENARKVNQGLDVSDPTELNFQICNFLQNRILFPNSNTEKSYPANETNTYLAAWGLDLGTPPPANREALTNKVTQLYLNLPEVRAINVMVQFIEDYLKKEAPQSIDHWR